MTEELKNRIDWFCQQVSKAIKLTWKCDHLPVPKLMIREGGRKYVSLCTFEKENENAPYKARTSYCYIDTTKNGDVVLGDWKGATKGAVRGNLFDSDILSKVGVYGVLYIRGPKFPSVAEILEEKNKNTENNS